MQPAAPEQSHIAKVSKRIFCDVSELTNLPPKPNNWPEIIGTSKRQIDWAKGMREQCLRRWRADLPDNVYWALENIADAGWWITHKNVAVDNIGWPSEWKALQTGEPGERNFQCQGCGKTRGPDERDSCCNPDCPEHKLSDKRDTMLAYYFSEGAPEAKADQIPTGSAEYKQGVVNFEAFARKMANSPELAYLTIMALFYRQTKDAYALSKFADSRQRVEGHLSAIDKILGSPGDL